MTTTITTPIITATDRVAGSLMGIFIADALAMPVHWYYDLNQLKHDFGKISKYEAPRSTFPGSIMNLSNTGGGGRGSDRGDIVGDVILHGKKKYWMKGGQFHYHHGMAAGDNTLEACITRLVIRQLSSTKCSSLDLFVKSYRSKYVKFLTTPNSHNDTYASTCHRMFFKNRQNGISLENCPDNDGHNVDAIDGLTAVIPVIFAAKSRNIDIDDALKNAISVTRNSTKLNQYASIYAEMLLSVSNGCNLRVAAQNAGHKLGINIAQSAKCVDPMSACYIDSSFPALLHFAYKYADNPTNALMANANAGGENVARGAALGALLGAAHGIQAWPTSLIEGLTATKSICSEIEHFVTEFYPSCGNNKTIISDL